MRRATLDVIPGALERPRVAELLGRRWTHRFVTITAGAGFGKSTALAQSILESADKHDRFDHHVALDVTCSDVSELLRRLSGTFDARFVDLPSIIDHLESLEGEHCLILDELHAVGAESEGFTLIRELVRSAPIRLHIVVASRSPVQLPLARARAASQVLDIGERDLAFDSEELAAYARAKQVEPSDLESTGGWPALAVLTAMAGHRGAIDFLTEEVINGLEAKWFDVLTCATLAGTADPTLLRNVTGFQGDTAEIAAGIPMVAIDDTGSLTPHDIWRDVVERHVFEDVRRRMLGDIAEHHRRNGDSLAAIRTATAAGDTYGLAEVARDVGQLGHVAMRIDDIERLLGQAPEAFESTAEGRLLRTIIARSHDPFSDDAKTRLQASYDEYRELGVVGCVVSPPHFCTPSSHTADSSRYTGAGHRMQYDRPTLNP